MFYVYTSFYDHYEKFKDLSGGQFPDWEELRVLPSYTEFSQEFQEFTQELEKDEIYLEEGYFVDNDYYEDDVSLLSDFSLFEWGLQTTIFFMIFLGLFDEALKFSSALMEQDQLTVDPKVFLEEQIYIFNRDIGESPPK